jgi:HD-GYP domain-containing protein (c-di-GMP phosphodiesterase class II)
LLAAAAIQLGADFLTAPLAIAPIARMHPLAFLQEVVRSALPLEAMQYGLAIPTYIAATVEPWAPALLIPALIALHHLCKRASELHEHSKLMLEHLAVAVDARDTYTGSHSRRVADFTAAILHAMTIVGPEAELIVAAARVHDIGKVDLPDSVLRKPGPLNAEERALIETHALRGAALVRSAIGFGRLAPLVAAHHEAFDGSGYPRGLAGERIPFGARVIAVADSFDAMTSDRPYRRGISRAGALAALRAGRGGQWDLAVVDALCAALPHLVENPGMESEAVAGTIAG